MKIERDKFLVQLERLKDAIPPKNEIPAFTHIWFDGKYARACNGGLGIQVPLETDFKLGVPGRTLLGLMQGTAVNEITTKESSAGLTLQIGRSRVNLATLPIEGLAWNFPDTLSHKTPFLEMTEEFLDGLRRVLFVKVAHKARVEHWGVTLFPEGDNVSLVTTNSRTMAQVTVAAKLPKQAVRAVLPRPFVEQIVAQCAPHAKLYVLSDCLIALDDNVRLFSTLLDNEAVTDMPALIKRYVGDGQTRFTIPVGVGETIQRAALLSSQEKDKEEVTILLGASEEGLSLEGDFTLGTVSETFELDGSAEEREIRLNLPEFQNCLKEAEEISLLKGACALFGANGFTCLIAAGVRKQAQT